ncbi:Lrp/AsnC family transcriptional regulator [Halococcus thailandensis]|uniref:Transcriptional regulator, AsnC family protein n=1 Tax=Halococcus thailandensis JCM 13552 TaxID=1227457 RepID=M0N2G1_9EURY|nr:Lrp/AsnC family transcriptional regulator [Halococcus thailandensis]EMA52127.1 transcriptional regulator, AsnC family protein [Halococcus thailandensis JCM 13552]
MDIRAELLSLLRENARYTTVDLARMLGTDESEVAEQIETLEAEGVLKGYQAVIDWRRTDEEPVRALVECNVTLDRETGYDDIAARLVGFPEIQSLRLVSGEYDFSLTVEADSMGEVSRFVSEKVAPVPEITQTVTHYLMESYKERGIEFDGDGDDDRLSVSP